MIVLHLNIDRLCSCTAPTSCAQQKHQQPSRTRRTWKCCVLQCVRTNLKVAGAAIDPFLLHRTDKTINNAERILTQEWARQLCFADTVCYAHCTLVYSKKCATKKWKMQKRTSPNVCVHTKCNRLRTANESAAGHTGQSIDLIHMCVMGENVCPIDRLPAPTLHMQNIRFADSWWLCVSSPEWAHKASEIVSSYFLQSKPRVDAACVWNRTCSVRNALATHTERFAANHQGEVRNSDNLSNRTIFY